MSSLISRQGPPLDTDDNIQQMIQKARELVAQQGHLAKERQQLRLDLRKHLLNSKNIRQLSSR
jgi:hypothetical protein